MSRIYVGNLSRETTEASLREALARDGRTVTWVGIKKIGTTGVSRGFAFADLSTPEESAAAIASLDGTQLDGRAIKVNHIRKEVPAPRERDSSAYEGSYGGNARRGRRW
jgi:RNA recognition motif-containing protein